MAEELGCYTDLGVYTICAPIPDGPLTARQWKKVMKVARRVAAMLQQGRTVLVTCYAGRNRSGVVVALVDMLLRHGSADDAVQNLRQVRKQALTNPWFVAYLKSL
jgi:protein-tyrosine phosphatase